MKHKLKLFAREAYARILFHTGLHALVNKFMPRRQTVLFGHCVEDPACNALLPGDMKLRADSLTRLLDWFQRRYAILPLAAGMDSLKNGAEKRSVVSLTMDDGYADNATRLLPLLAERNQTATVFLEARPLDERRVNWSHKFFWTLSQGQSAEDWARAYMLASEDEDTREAFRRLLEEDNATTYQVKRILKYDADPKDRDAQVDALFEAAGGDERKLCDTLYMTWDQARQLEAAGFEVGGHTVNHVILSKLAADEARAEIEGSRASLDRELKSPSRVFAYPFGRFWDYDETSQAAVRDAGFELAVNTHAGTNNPESDPMQLRRIPIDDDSKLHLLATEACGGFDLLRRFGVDLSE